MKQFYYGNNFFEQGYQVLKKSDGISASGERLMEKLAPPFSSLAVGESEIGFYTNGSECVFFQNTNNAPDINSGINRPTFFSHQYYADAREAGDVLQNADKLIGGMRFESEYFDACDISEAYPSRNEFWDKTVPDNFIAALSKTLTSGGKLIVYGAALTCGEVRKIMACAAASANVHRERMSFVMSGKAKDKRLEMFNIIFCPAKSIMSFKESFYKNCIYYDYDTDTSVDTYTLPNTEAYTEEYTEEYIYDKCENNETDDFKEDTELKEEVRKLKLISIIILFISLICLIMNLFMLIRLEKTEESEHNMPFVESEVIDTSGWQNASEKAESEEKADNKENEDKKEKSESDETEGEAM